MAGSKNPYNTTDLREQVTPEWLFLSRRSFMRASGVAAGALALAACAPSLGGGSSAGSDAASSTNAATSTEALEAAVGTLPPALAHSDPYVSAQTDELGDEVNGYDEITHYNNYYEFSLDKEDVNGLSRDFTTYPWNVNVTGMVSKPGVYSIENLIQNFDQQERIYRLRCVEAWSMVIPWVGFTLASLLNEVQPTADAKFVKFTSVLRPEEMPGQQTPMLDWPYVEGLRLDEAMNDLTLMATGMYGKLLDPANGAPLRLVVPWKYGFKSIKGIVEIELTDMMPVSTWSEAAPREYGFYANVNPEVNHPRWSQATERRIGEGGRRATIMYNGYADQVESMYKGMDLGANY